MIALLERLDERIVRVERIAVAAMLAAMGLAVFLDVMHRVSTREGSYLANPFVVAVCGAIVAVAALRTRGVASAIPAGFGMGVALAAAQWAFVRILPNGLVWSQAFALALTLWLGTVGASLAAHSRRHLALDVGSKLWPKAIAHRVAALGHLATALFCFGILLLSAPFVFEAAMNWWGTGRAGGNLSGTSIPLWMATLAIPYGMTVLTFRFGLEAARTWLGLVEDTGDDTLHQLGITTKEAL